MTLVFISIMDYRRLKSVFHASVFCPIQRVINVTKCKNNLLFHVDNFGEFNERIVFLYYHSLSFMYFKVETMNMKNYNPWNQNV